MLNIFKNNTINLNSIAYTSIKVRLQGYRVLIAMLIGRSMGTLTSFNPIL